VASRGEEAMPSVISLPGLDRAIVRVVAVTTAAAVTPRWLSHTPGQDDGSPSSTLRLVPLKA
jgi:hypothetical protein